MALPAGVLTANLTFGLGMDDAGVPLERGRVTILASLDRVWAATGDLVLARNIVVELDGTAKVLPLAATDQPGMVNREGLPVIDWTLDAVVDYPGRARQLITFALPTGGVDGLPIDFDRLVPVEQSDGQTIAVTMVTSVDGDVGPVLTGRVHILLAIGQSNMSGRGLPYGQITDPANPRIYQYGAKVPGLTVASEPLDMRDTATGIGPALQFARAYLQTLPPQDRVVIVPAAEGGTRLCNNAANGWRWGVPGNLTAQAMAQLDAALLAIAPQGWGAATVEAVLCAQGESDGTDGTTGTVYQADLDLLVAGLRSVYGATLPFIIGAMPPETLAGGSRRQINAAQSNLPYRTPGTGFATGPAGYITTDLLHYTAAGQRVLSGRMFAEFQRVRAGIAPTTPAEPYLLTSDDFNRADSTLTVTPDGRAWVTSQAAQVLSNVAKFTANSPSAAYGTVDVGTADGVVGLKLVSDGAVGGSSGMVFRYVDVNNHLLVTRVSAGDLRYRIVKRVGGVITAIAEASSKLIVNGDVLELWMVGDSLRLYVNSALVIDALAPGAPVGTAHGFYRGTAAPPTFDDYTFKALR